MSPATSVTPASQEIPGAEFPPSGWILKETAAKLLKRSESRVAAMAQEEGLDPTPAKPLRSRKMENPQSKQMVTLIQDGSVEAVLFARQHPDKVIKTPANLNNHTRIPSESRESTGSTDLAAKPDNPENRLITVDFTAVLQRVLEVARQPLPAPRPWLTVDEAVEFSGLTKQWLRSLAESAVKGAVEGDLTPLEVRIAIRDMGKGSRGGRWRFHRDSLEKV